MTPSRHSKGGEQVKPVNVEFAGTGVKLHIEDVDPEMFFDSEHEIILEMADGSRWRVEYDGMENGLGAQEPVTAKLVMIDEGKRDELPTIAAGCVTKTDFPLDKVNAKIWKLLEGAPSGQLGIGFDSEIPGGKIAIDVAKSGSTATVPVVYSIDFSKLEGLTISKKLEPWDKRVYIALAALFNAGYEVVSLQQIYNAMGYEGDAGANDYQKINDSVTKMARADITLDNLRETEIYNRRGHFKYDGSLLPMERIQAITGGNVTESAIHLFREPPVITFSRERKQITTIDVKLLNSPLSKTSANIQLEDYLIERIARIKKNGGKISNKILFETVFANCGVKTRMQRTRALPKIEKLLEHYKECGFIEGYKTAPDGVEIFY